MLLSLILAAACMYLKVDYVNNYCIHNNYRIVGNFRMVEFSYISYCIEHHTKISLHKISSTSLCWQRHYAGYEY